MKISPLALTLLSLGATNCAAFTFTRSANAVTTSYSRSSVIVNMAGIEGTKRKKEKEPDPAEKVEVYVKEPEPMEPRANLDGRALVSGWVNAQERSDQFVFDLLNNHDGISAFDFQQIVAFVDDGPFAKKRLLSRSSRYNGLLDKLDIVQAGAPGDLPTVEALSGINCWIAHVECVEGLNVEAKLSDIANLAKLSGVKNVAVLVSNALGFNTALATQLNTRFSDSATDFTVAFTGTMDDMKAEGSHPYRILNMEDVTEEAGAIVTGTFSREEATRIVAESLGLKSAACRTVALQNVPTDSRAAVLIKGLRSAGYGRCQEINDIFDRGVERYEEAIETYKREVWEKENPDPELVEKQRQEDMEKMRLERIKRKEEFEQQKKEEIESMATEWAKREYFRKNLGGNIAMSEEEYIKSVWERAMFEGDLKYRMMHGGDTDERKELKEFLEEQERKKQVALKRAQEALDKAGGYPSGDDGDKSD
mmetsp:Transcript_33886/g.49071  ORF Transcript_33886/g.49071 Transcript_33886/m.49071 type:complete len:479 (-) Transcript_33886:300-1736(-)|eukprot:CAMPEP_0116020406 /NCGR_PEP_ID=MMETSP0321-20121206/9776_1 /TAXON_ID=163516 /ORGANISM="Leptocylindrus danicus var. danicus, Strain B650" /LENGTH=478 /DNA_ID=CAMNT_0003491087 /DNA_START=259 /DNA_END=1695 /DNA_ORIENTATION=+